LGVKVSFVQSTTMDSWKPVHLKMMQLGGNRRFAEFLREHGVPEDMPLRQKYRTRAAEWYRKNLRAMAEGTTAPEPLPDGVGHLLTEDAASQTAALLDDVFAAAPSCGAMTRGGVPLVVRTSSRLSTSPKREQPDSQLSPRTRAAMSLPDWFATQLDWMTLSPGSRCAEKLRTMSTGSMPGIGPKDMGADRFCSSVEDLSRQAACAA